MQYIPLPEYKPSPLMDLSPLASALDSRQRAQQAQAEALENKRRFELQNTRADAQLGLSQNADQRATEMAPLDRQYKLAQIEASRHKTAMGGEQPSNVREWQYYNSLSPEQQQQYLTMKRAEKYLDLGTHYQRPNAVDPAQPGPTFQKNLAGAEREKAVGQAGGKAVADLPRIVDNASQTLDLIQNIKTNPGTARNFGVMAYVPNMPGGQAADAWSRIEQLGGKAFLEAYSSLKGGGQITEVEGKKATDAIVAMNKAQSYESFVQALNDFESVIRAGVERARGAARGGASAPPAGGGFSIRRLD